MRPRQGMESCQKHFASSKKRTRLHSTHPRKNGYSWLRQQKSRRKKEFVVDSGASMHMVSKKELYSAEVTRNPTTVMTANGEVQTSEEATVYVKQLDLFVTVMLLEETPAVLSLGKLCEDHGYTYHWTRCQKKTASHQKMARKSIAICRTTFHSLSFVNEFLHVIFTYFFNIFIAGFCVWHGKSSNRKKCEYECRVTEESVARTSRHFPLFSWITNGAGSESGVGLG